MNNNKRKILITIGGFPRITADDICEAAKKIGLKIDLAALPEAIKNLAYENLININDGKLTLGKKGLEHLSKESGLLAACKLFWGEDGIGKKLETISSQLTDILNDQQNDNDKIEIPLSGISPINTLETLLIVCDQLSATKNFATEIIDLAQGKSKADNSKKGGGGG